MSQAPQPPQTPMEPLRRDAAEAFLALCDVMTRLRSPTGCAWDREQTLHTLRSYLLEETHEVLDVLDSLTANGEGPRSDEHKEELGDLLLQIVFQSELQREQGRFDVGDVAQAIHDKLVRRHPHIFGDEAVATDGPARLGKARWEEIKREERKAKGEAEASALSALAGVPTHLPALLRALRLGEKAHAVGFDWPDHRGVVDKIKEELGEVEEALASGDKGELFHEIGDLLYAIVNLSRHMEIDPEAALRGTIVRFENRFRHLEEAMEKDGKETKGADLETLESYWDQAKKALK